MKTEDVMTTRVITVTENETKQQAAACSRSTVLAACLSSTLTMSWWGW